MSFLAREIAGTARLLPRSVQVAIRQSLAPVGRLDHPTLDVRMSVDTDIELFRLGSCAKEPETVEWIDETVSEGDVLFDVGANVGAYALIAAHRVGANGSVWAFEPGFATFSTLVRNVMLNRLEDRVTAVNLALADRSGFTPLAYSTTTSGGAMHSFGQRAQSGWQPVLTERLDTFVERYSLPSPTHLKLDVDGAEPLVLRGAPSVLAALRHLLLEVDDEDSAEAREIVGLVERAGLSFVSSHRHARSGVSNLIFRR